MTVAAVIDPCGKATLISDLMIGATGISKSHARLPFADPDELNNLMPIDWQRIIVGMCRKLHVPFKNMAVAWSGHKFVAAHVLSCIETIVAIEGSITYEQLKACLSEIEDPGEQFDCDLIGAICEEGEFAYFRWNIKDKTLQEVSPPGAIGEGARVFDYMERVRNSLVVGQGSSEMECNLNSLSCVTHFLGDELFFRDHASFLFGGGYEIATYRDTGFELVDDVLYLFWRVNFLSETEIRFVPKIYHYRYDLDVLHINELEGIQRDPNCISVNPVRGYKVSRQRGESGGQGSLPRNPRFFCNYVIAGFEGTNLTTSSEIVLPADNRYFKYRTCDDKGLIDISESWFADLRGNLSNMRPPDSGLEDFPYIGN